MPQANRYSSRQQSATFIPALASINAHGPRQERNNSIVMHTVKGLISVTGGMNSRATLAMSTAPIAGMLRKASRGTNLTWFHSPGSPYAAPEPVSSDSKALSTPASTVNTTGDPGMVADLDEIARDAGVARVALMRTATAGREGCHTKLVEKVSAVNGAGG
jgi:hypothetical protein